jgi:flagellar basal-body rod protein FlgG
MSDTIYEAAKNLHHQMKNMEVIANNLANINSTGYKRQIPFTEYLAREENQGRQITDFSEGNFIETGNPFDLALTGSNFFMLKTERGIEITKDGRFEISDDGYLVNDNGEKVVSESGEVNLFEFVIEKNATVKITSNGEIKVGTDVIDKIAVAKIENQDNLVRTEGQQFYDPGEDYETPPESDYQIHQGFLEESNTNAIYEMQYMIKINRDYESSQKLIREMDEMMGKAKEIGTVQ